MKLNLHADDEKCLRRRRGSECKKSVIKEGEYGEKLHPPDNFTPAIPYRR